MGLILSIKQKIILIVSVRIKKRKPGKSGSTKSEFRETDSESLAFIQKLRLSDTNPD